MTLSEFALLLASVLSSVTGQFLLKSGALKLGEVSAGNVVSHILRIIMIPDLVGGLIVYGLGAISYILLLTRVDLSVAGPAIALSYVFSVILGNFLFRETIPIARIIGVGLIVCGVILVIWQKPQG